MIKTISINDDVYRRLKRKTGDRSFSEFIADTLDNRGQLADVTGQQTLDAEANTEVGTEIGRLTDGIPDDGS